nr:putative integron gene cassette protein [uncultured bacterium]
MGPNPPGPVPSPNGMVLTSFLLATPGRHLTGDNFGLSFLFLPFSTIQACFRLPGQKHAKIGYASLFSTKFSTSTIMFTPSGICGISHFVEGWSVQAFAFAALTSFRRPSCNEQSSKCLPRYTAHCLHALPEKGQSIVVSFDTVAVDTMTSL